MSRVLQSATRNKEKSEAISLFFKGAFFHEYQMICLTEVEVRLVSLFLEVLFRKMSKNVSLASAFTNFSRNPQIVFASGTVFSDQGRGVA